MKDDNYIKLMQARREVKRLAEAEQTHTSRKLVRIPMGVYDELMEAVRQILLEELGE